MIQKTSFDVRLGKWTRREFRQAIESCQLKGCILPLAAVEQHLEHMAMEHDWRSVNIIAEQIAEALRPGVVVAQGIMAGISEHHMKHPGTLSLSPGTFLSVVDDLVDSLVRAGFENILVLNGHGGNVIPCQQTWDQFLRRYPVNLHFMSYWDVLNQEDALDLLEGGHRLPEDLPGHAQEFETSMALRWFSENVRSQAMQDQKDRSPLLGTREKGEAFTRRIVERLTDYMHGMLAGSRKQTIPPFHP